MSTRTDEPRHKTYVDPESGLTVIDLETSRRPPDAVGDWVCKDCSFENVAKLEWCDFCAYS